MRQPLGLGQRGLGILIMDIIIKYQEGYTAGILKNNCGPQTMFTNIFNRNKVREPFYIKEDLVYHLEGESIIGYSIPCGGLVMDSYLMRLNRLVSSYRWIKPITMINAPIKIDCEWLEATFKKDSVFITNKP